MSQKIVLDFEFWNLEDYIGYEEARRKADFDKQAQLAAKIIRSWDFEVEVSYENLMDLPMGLIKTITGIISEELAAVTGETVPGFRVDLTQWKVRDLNSYSKALMAFNTEEMLRHIQQVVQAVPVGYPKPETISHKDFRKAMSAEKVFKYLAAISSEIAESMNEKN